MKWDKQVQARDCLLFDALTRCALPVHASDRFMPLHSPPVGRFSSTS